MVDRGFPSIDGIDNRESADIRQGFTFQRLHSTNGGQGFFNSLPGHWSF